MSVFGLGVCERGGGQTNAVVEARPIRHQKFQCKLLLGHAPREVVLLGGIILLLAERLSHNRGDAPFLSWDVGLMQLDLDDPIDVDVDVDAPLRHGNTPSHERAHGSECGRLLFTGVSAEEAPCVRHGGEDTTFASAHQLMMHYAAGSVIHGGKCVCVCACFSTTTFFLVLPGDHFWFLADMQTSIETDLVFFPITLSMIHFFRKPSPQCRPSKQV